MRNSTEDIWTISIAEQLKKELDQNKYEVVCFEKLPYNISINNYIDGNIDTETIKTMKYETDLLIKEKIGNKYIPRLVIESKYTSITTHGVITYSNKAKAHKNIHNGLRYGLMIGKNGSNGIPARVVKHGDDFDFMISFECDIPSIAEWETFINIINKNINHSIEYENIINNRLKRKKKKYYCIEKDIKYYG